ncbi:hypothetical protein BH23ACT12_BH23ACT12_06430 [soil metagenome]
MPIARLLFALLVLAMAIGPVVELLRVCGDHSRLPASRGETLSRILSLALVAGELFAGIGLLTGGPRFGHLAGSVGFGVAVTWSALAVQAFLRGIDVANCGCFGRYLAQRLSWFPGGLSLLRHEARDDHRAQGQPPAACSDGRCRRLGSSPAFRPQSGGAGERLLDHHFANPIRLPRQWNPPSFADRERTARALWHTT